MTKLRGRPGVDPDLTPVLDRLAARSHFEPGPLETPCLVWEGARAGSGGYGHIGVADQSSGLVHRLAWIARHGEPPTETPCVLHHCDNPPCWRDGHLFLGTNADNTHDMVAKGRHGRPHARKTHCPYGHPYDAANTYIDKRRGWRQCLACKRIREAALRAHKRSRAKHS